MAESSRKLKTKTVLEKYKILKEIEKGETCTSIVRENMELQSKISLSGTFCEESHLSRASVKWESR